MLHLFERGGKFHSPYIGTNHVVENLGIWWKVNKNFCHRQKNRVEMPYSSTNMWIPPGLLLALFLFRLPRLRQCYRNRLFLWLPVLHFCFYVVRNYFGAWTFFQWHKKRVRIYVEYILTLWFCTGLRLHTHLIFFCFIHIRNPVVELFHGYMSWKNKLSSVAGVLYSFLSHKIILSHRMECL